MVLQDDELIVAEPLGDASAFRLREDDAAKRVKYRLRLVESAAILSRVLEL